jgi:Pyridoxamine 5'-phosphate oxidase
MSIPVSLERLRDEIRGFGAAPYLLTVSDDGRPHCVSVAIDWQGDDIVIGAGNRTTANAAARPSVSLLWAPKSSGGYSLIVDGTVTSTSGSGDGDNRVTMQPTGAVLHRPATDGGSDCEPVLRT